MSGLGILHCWHKLLTCCKHVALLDVPERSHHVVNRISHSLTALKQAVGQLASSMDMAIMLLDIYNYNGHNHAACNGD